MYKELTVYLLAAVLGGATFPAGAHEAGVLPEARLLQLGQAVVAVDVHLALCSNPSQTHTLHSTLTTTVYGYIIIIRTYMDTLYM